MTKKTIHFEFSQGLVKEPLLYLLARKFDVVTNIRAASVTDEGGFVVLEVEGDETVIQEAVDYLVGAGNQGHGGSGRTRSEAAEG